MECAIQFAGMQCQIQFNDHVETKHKPGFIEYALLSPILSITRNRKIILGRNCVACTFVPPHFPTEFAFYYGGAGPSSFLDPPNPPPQMASQSTQPLFLNSQLLPTDGQIEGRNITTLSSPTGPHTVQ